SAVNLPITSASLRFIVVWMGVRSIRCTYLGTRVPPRFTCTTNFVFFIVCHYFCPPPRNAAQNVTAFSEHHRSTIQPVRYWKELKEVLTMHGHRTSPVQQPRWGQPALYFSTRIGVTLTAVRRTPSSKPLIEM